jgi:guanylate kinase
VSGRLVVLSGPSGVGKGTVLEEVRRQLPELWTSVSVTTREPRPGETDGVHYWFVDRPTYDQLVADGALLEHDEHFGAGYGTPRAPVERALAEGRPAVLEIDYKGARQVRDALGELAQLVMLVPPDVEELVRRITTRGTEDPADVARRLARVQEELAAAADYDRTITNVSVREAAGELLDLLRSPDLP